MFRAVLLVALVSAASAELATTSKKAISAAVKDTSVNGVEGVNLVWNAPFKVDDYTVGFKYSLAKLGQAPDVIFARREFNVDENKITVQTDLDMSKSEVAVSADWSNGKLEVSLEGNSAEKLTMVGAKTNFEVQGRKVDVEAEYNVQSKVISGEAGVHVDDLVATLKYDTEKKDAVVSVAKPIDDSNTVIPSYALNSGTMKLGWLRKWTGGSLETTFHPDDKVVLEWKDEGVNGVWTTTAEVPLSDRTKSKVSFSRDWNY